MGRSRERVRRLVPHILHLLGSGLTQRAVARQLGVSRSTIVSIVSGEWTRKDRESLQRLHNRLMGKDEATGIIYPREDTPYTRCPTCRALVKMPCLRCQIAALPTNRRFRNVEE